MKNLLTKTAEISESFENYNFKTNAIYFLMNDHYRCNRGDSFAVFNGSQLIDLRSNEPANLRPQTNMDDRGLMFIKEFECENVGTAVYQILRLQKEVERKKNISEKIIPYFDSNFLAFQKTWYYKKNSSRVSEKTIQTKYKLWAESEKKMVDTANQRNKKEYDEILNHLQTIAPEFPSNAFFHQ